MFPSCVFAALNSRNAQTGGSLARKRGGGDVMMELWTRLEVTPIAGGVLKQPDGRQSTDLRRRRRRGCGPTAPHPMRGHRRSVHAPHLDPDNLLTPRSLAQLARDGAAQLGGLLADILLRFVKHGGASGTLRRLLSMTIDARGRVRRDLIVRERLDASTV